MSMELLLFCQSAGGFSCTIALVPETTVSGTGLTRLEYPLKPRDFEGYFVPKLVPKSMSLLSYIIGTGGGDYEELHLWLCPCQHGATEP